MRGRVGLAVAVASLGLVACAPELPPNDARIGVPLGSPAPSAHASAPASASAAPWEAEAETASTAAAPDACLTMAEGLSVEQRVGQLYMLGVSTSGVDETTRSAILDGSIGSVVLLGNTTAGAAPIRLLTAELGSLAPAELPLLVSVDQEGGAVQRLQGEGFTRIPSAREQGDLPARELAKKAKAWGQELHDAGVLYNLAPVGDTVAEAARATNAPVGALRRDFGADPARVAASALEFIEGMHEAGIRASVKHFPGLGQVQTNTDFGVAHDTEVTADSETLEPFRVAIDAGVDSVMVSSAIFTLIDPDNEGVFSESIITDLLRDGFGYDGVVIADDLGAAKAVKGVEPAQRGGRFIAAGGDLAINADPRLMGAMIDATLDRVTRDEAFAGQVTRSTARVLALKESAGLLTCG